MRLGATGASPSEARLHLSEKSALAKPGGLLVLPRNIETWLQKTPWQRILLIFALLPALAALNSCKKSSTPTTTSTTPTIVASCASSTVTVNGQVQCTATITNLSSTIVDWSVTGTGTGTIDANGLYKAPATVPSNNVVTITAAAHAQTTLTTTATITIQPPTTISAIVCSGSTQTSSLAVASGMSLACTATSASNTPIPVFWQVNTVTGGTATLGLMSAQGNYVAPLVPPAGGTVTLTAVSQAVSTQTLSVPVTVTFGNRVLKGSYAFSTSGRLTATNGFFARAGSFVADGNGGLTAGLEDVNPQPGGITQKPISFSGSYSIGPDGRGTIQFCEPSTSNVCTVPQTQFRFVVLSPQEAQMIDFQAGSVANGEIVLQPDNSVFNTGSLIGTYTFSFSGFSSATTEESVVGEFVADGAGKITSGELDINTGGVLTSQAAITGGTYTVSANGRGTATLVTSGATFNLAFYMISASRAKFIETDALPILAGDSFKQQSIVPWGPNSLNGSVVFETAGTTVPGGVFLADVGAFTTDGIANVTGGSGLLDQNIGGAVTSTAFGGTYTVDTMGRGTISIPSHSYVIYMTSVGNAVVQETTASTVAHGFLTQPQGGPFTSASLSGSYALNLAGQNAAIRKVDVAGQLAANGTGILTGGLLDINNFGTLQTGQATSGTYTSVALSGRSTILLNPTRNLVLYFVSPARMYVLDTDPAGAATGAAIGSFYKQF